MPMSLHALLAYSGLAAALVLLAASQSRALPIVAVLAGALQVLRALGVIHLEVRHVPLGLVLGVALCVPAVIAWFKATAKSAVTAAAIASFVGAAQVVTILLAGRS
jgi:hypothetical protein